MKRKLNILVACEESQACCRAFRKLGHNAYSCDLFKCSGTIFGTEETDEGAEWFQCRGQRPQPDVIPIPKVLRETSIACRKVCFIRGLRTG